MQARRWWFSAALAVCLATALPALGDPPPAPGSPPAALQAYVKAQAAKMSAAATAEDAQTLRKETQAFLTPPRGVAAPTPVEVDAYTRSIATEFGPVIETSSKDYVRLNGIILLAGIDHINTDGVLRTALANENPGVRYWAARGLATILPRLRPVAGAYGRAIDALMAGVMGEKIPLVRAEMARALAATNDASLTKVPAALAKALSNEAASFAKMAPGGAEMNAAAAEMDAATALVKAGLVLGKADETALVQAAADATSFAAQQENKAGGPLASEAAVDLAKSAVELFKATGKGAKISLTVPPKATPADLLFGVNDLTGSEAGAGAVEKAFADVKVPARLK